MQILKDFIEKNGKKAIINLMVLLAIGIGLLLFSRSGMFRQESEPPALLHNNEPYAHVATEPVDLTLTQELEEILSLVAGAGEVRVMLTMQATSEVHFAQNQEQSISQTTETDTQGGERQVESRQYSVSHVIMRGADGSDMPLVIQELLPRIEGVIIVAQGGGNIEVASALIRAAHTVLGIAPHQVQVFQMAN